MVNFLNPKTTAKKLIAFISSTVKKEKYRGVLIAVSGGIDSAVSLTLSVKALGKNHVHPVLLPYGKLNDEGTKDASLVIESMDIPQSQVQAIDIKPFVDRIIQYDPPMDAIRIGNVMARMRMVILYDLFRKQKRLIVGTENKTEHLLGYYTRFGDEASDIEPLKNLYKTQVFALAKYLRVPKKILAKKPTAGLWEGQTDEVLYLYKEKRLSKKQIIAKGYDRELIEKIWWWIEKGEFKDRLPHVF